MGFAIHIQRVDGREADLQTVDISTSLETFNSIPWNEEIVQWEQVSEEEIEQRRPFFQLLDDSGHSLYITAYSDHLIWVAYTFPPASSPFGVDYDSDEDYVATDQYPRAEVQALFDCFSTCDIHAMLSLLDKYPMLSDSNEP